MDNGIPRHIAIIMDGNGRWARQRQMPRVAGHRAGVEAVREIVKGCAMRGVEALTLFSFSSENWRRPKREVRLLMDLFITALEQEVDRLNENNVRLRVIGDITAFSPRLQRCIAEAEALTAANTGLSLVVAANYGGRWDIAQAASAVMRERALRQETDLTITPEQIEQHLALAELPEPDLFIRSGGEKRISNFLLWQLAYTELYFTDRLWPDFDDDALAAAIDSYRGRQRRFGMTGEQIEEGAPADSLTTSA